MDYSVAFLGRNAGIGAQEPSVPKYSFVFQKEIGEMMCFGENQYGKEISEEQIAEIITEM